MSVIALAEQLAQAIFSPRRPIKFEQVDTLADLHPMVTKYSAALRLLKLVQKDLIGDTGSDFDDDIATNAPLANAERVVDRLTNLTDMLAVGKWIGTTKLETIPDQVATFKKSFDSEEDQLFVGRALYVLRSVCDLEGHGGI